MAFNPIEIIIGAKDEASAVLGKLQTKIAAVGVALASYVGVKVFAGAVESAAGFEAAMSRVEAATGATGQELADLKKAAADAGASSAFTAQQAAGALENLAKAGLSSKEAIQALNPVLSLATAADVDLATAAEYVSKAVMGMGLSFDDAGRVADVLAKGANASNTSVSGLAEALSYTAPIAKTVGVSLEETVAIIGKLADSGIDASRAGTALNNILSQFSDPASTFRKALAGAGITTNDFSQALRQLEAAGPAGEAAIRAVGLEAGPALRSLLNQGTAALDGLTAKLKDAQGSAAEAAAVMQNNLNGSFKGLSSAWEGVQNALATPVLPVLTSAVNELATALRTSISDGTISKFGETIKQAFVGGVQAAKDFIGTLDVQAILARLQGWAQGAKDTFTAIAEYASNAGSAVQTAWGVMSAGTNAVLAAIYKVAEAFSGVASGVQSGLALIMEGFAKVTFGSVSASFAAAAAEISLSAEATWAVSEAFADKASAAFDAAAKGAETAQNGWAGLTASAEAAAPAMDKVAGSADGVAKSAEKAAKAQDQQAQAAIKNKAAAEDNAAAIQQLLTQYADLVGKGDLKAAEAVMGQVNARMSAGATDATSSAQAIATLRQEYDALIAKGDLQAAALKMEEINRQMAATGQSAATAVASAKAVEDAFTRLGITSTQSLENLARQAQADFELIRDSGTASSRDVEQAFFKAAQAAIDAADGTVPAWVRAQAGVHGYALQVNAAGEEVLVLKSKLKDVGSTNTSVTGKMVGEWGKVAEAAKEAKKQIDTDGKEIKEQISAADGGGTISALAYQQGAEDVAALDAWWEEWSRDYAEKNRKTGGTSSSFSQYWYQTQLAQYQQARKELEQQERIDQKAADKRATSTSASTTTSTSTSTSGAGWGGVPAGAKPPAGWTNPWAPPENYVDKWAPPKPATTATTTAQTININLGGKALGSITTDADGQQTLEALLAELERSAFISGATLQ